MATEKVDKAVPTDNPIHGICYRTAESMLDANRKNKTRQLSLFNQSLILYNFQGQEYAEYKPRKNKTKAAHAFVQLSPCYIRTRQSDVCNQL